MSATKQGQTTCDGERGEGAVIVRVWHAKINPARKAYRRFEQERCLPMLHKQPGLLGVLFL
jgi:hypothetical protein